MAPLSRSFLAFAPLALLLSSCAQPGPAKPSPLPIRPAAAQRTSASLRVAVRPLGSIPFDALSLPLTSPDGRHIAAQHGGTPSWPAVLAEPGRDGLYIPPGLRITAYTIQRSGAPGPALAPIAWPDPLPRGLLMGRSCDDLAFLVEQPLPDGSRRIGRVQWGSGALEWLVQPDSGSSASVAAFATLGPAGELVYSRRDADAAPFALVFRPRAGDTLGERTLASDAESYLCPAFTADPARFFAFAIPAGHEPRGRLSIIAIDLPATDDAPLRISSRIALPVDGSALTAFQAAISLQTPWPSLDGVAPSPLHRGVPFVSIDTAAMAWFDPASNSIIPLARLTIGAAPLIATTRGRRVCTGVLLGTARELLFQPLAPAGSSDPLAPPAFGPDVPIIAGSYVPRLTSGEEGAEGGAGRGAGRGGGGGARRYLLLAPPVPGARDATDSVQVLEMAPAPAQ